jgi:hypothetical protein
MRFRVSVCLLVCLLAVLAAAPPAFAAGPRITGIVTDATGAALPATRVVVRDLASGREQSVETGADGRYDIDVASPAGTYLVIATRAGFSESARTVVLEAGRDRIDVPLRLEVGAFTTEVSVTASRDQLSTGSSSQSAVGILIRFPSSSIGRKVGVPRGIQSTISSGEASTTRQACARHTRP